MSSEAESTAQLDQLSKGPLVPVYLRTSLPIVLALVANGTYGIVDAIFVARGLGMLPMGGISMALPLQMVLFALGLMVGSGAASVVGRRLGEDDRPAAGKAAGTSMFLGSLIGLIAMVAGYFGLAQLLINLGAYGDLFEFAYQYALPLLLGAPIIILLTVFAELLRAEAKIGQMTGLLVLSTIINIILDALFIFVFEWGVPGVAYATLIAQAIALSIALWMYLSKRTLVKLQWQKSNTNAGEILALGLPAIFGTAGIAITIGLINYLLAQQDDKALAEVLISSYGIVGRIAAFIQLPLRGLTVGFQTLASFNYGKQEFRRLKQALILSLAVTTGYGFLCTLLLLSGGTYLMSMFTSELLLAETSAYITSVYFLCFALNGPLFVAAGLFQALGDATRAGFLAFFKPYLLIVPLSLLLPAWIGFDLIWWVFPVADVVAATVAGSMLLVWARRIDDDAVALSQTGAAD